MCVAIGGQAPLSWLVFRSQSRSVPQAVSIVFASCQSAIATVNLDAWLSGFHLYNRQMRRDPS